MIGLEKMDEAVDQLLAEMRQGTRWAELVPGYAVGSLGAFWFIQRVAILLRAVS